MKPGEWVRVPTKYTVFGAYLPRGIVERVWSNGTARVRMMAVPSQGRVGYAGHQEVTIPLAELEPLDG